MEHIKNSTPYRLYAYYSPKGALLYRGSGIAGRILRIKIFNFEKIEFLPKKYMKIL